MDDVTMSLKQGETADLILWPSACSDVLKSTCSASSRPDRLLKLATAEVGV